MVVLLCVKWRQGFKSSHCNPNLHHLRLPSRRSTSKQNHPCSPSLKCNYPLLPELHLQQVLMKKRTYHTCIRWLNFSPWRSAKLRPTLGGNKRSSLNLLSFHSHNILTMKTKKVQLNQLHVQIMALRSLIRNVTLFPRTVMIKVIIVLVSIHFVPFYL